MRDIKKIFLMTTLIVLLISLTAFSATDTNSNTTSDVDKISTTTQTQDNVEKAVTNPTKKEVTKKESSKIKTATSTVTATSYNDLLNKITTTTADTLNVNLNRNNVYRATETIPVIGNTLKRLTINGNGASITGNNSGVRFLYINSSKTVTLNDIKISKLGNGSINGGAIYSKGDLTVNNCNFTDCVSISGGAIKSDEGNLTIKNSRFTNNGAVGSGDSGCGGAIFQYTNLSMKIENSVFKDNYAKNMGGAILQRENSTMEVSNTTFENNDANSGGAISQNAYSEMIILDSTFNNNTAITDMGGAICSYGRNSNITIDKSEFNKNRASIQGGAIKSSRQSSVLIENSEFAENKAQIGTVVYQNSESMLSIINSTVLKNNVTNSIIYNNESLLHIQDSNFVENNANKGYILDLTTNTDVEIIDSSFTGHTGANGDNLFSNTKTSTLNISNNEYKNNSLNATIIAPETMVLVQNPTDYVNFTVNTTVRDIYNTTIKSGYLRVYANGNDTGLYPLTDGTADISLEKEYLKSIENVITLEFVNAEGCEDYQAPNTTFDIIFSNVNLTVEPITGVIGENITLTAHVKDLEGNNITGGNLVFKLNGKTLREDGRFDSNASALKFRVKDGLVSVNITADLYLRNAKNLTASYSGTSVYNETRSEVVTAQIQKRYASIEVSATPEVQKQHQVITFTAKVTDVTKNHKNETLINYDTYVMFKVNGVTLKDENGTAIKVKVGEDNTASYNYTIAPGTGGITSTGSTRDYSVTAVFVGDNYYPDVKNETKFNVERSTVDVNFENVMVSEANVLSINATLTDYAGSNVVGTNKILIKINGKSLVNSTTGKAIYYSVKDGVINLTDIIVDPEVTIKRVMLVTGERQAYLESRNETLDIKREE